MYPKAVTAEITQGKPCPFTYVAKVTLLGYTIKAAKKNKQGYKSSANG